MSKPFFKPFLVLLYAFLMLFLYTLLGFVLAIRLGRRRAMANVGEAYFRHMSRIWGVHHEIHGWENLPAEIREGRQPVIYIANHASYLDAMMLACYLPNHPVFLAKTEMLFIPVLGVACWMGGCIFINRRNRTKAIASLKRAARQIHDGATIAAFPEGTRTRDGALLPFKKGVFNLAQDADVPVVPLGLTGGFAMLPAGGWRVTPGTFRIHVGQPIHPSAIPDLDLLREAAHAAVKALVAKG
jgi:1-acyl-sn-glycerol-3-phosphate acyltransferase